MKEKIYSIILSVLFKQEDHYWVAQALEYDIAAQGKNLREAQIAFEKTIVGQIILDVKDNLKPLSGIGKAPEFYWELFKNAARLKEEKKFTMPNR